jgi:hypothetical protein
MANISILSTPAQSLTYKMVPVYNGLPFVVNSSQKDRQNFKYVADVYVSNVKITTLKQNKDISNLSYGIFDIGRIVENYILTTRPVFLTQGFAGNLNEYKSYSIKFGVEFERYLSITSIVSSSGFARVTFSTPHELIVGDYIVISNTKVHNYKAKVTLVGSTFVRTDLPYQGQNETSGSAIECEGFYDNAFVSGGYIGFTIPITRPTRIQVGDRVVVIQDTVPIQPTKKGYDGEWLCTSIYNQVIGGVTYQIIATDCPYLGDTPVNGGAIYSISKYSFKELTTSTVEYAWDGGLQYKEFLSYNPINYAMNTTNKGQFLTSSPRTLKIRRDESSILTSFNTSIMGSSTIKKGVFKTYDSDGTLQATYSYNIGGTSSTTAIVNMGVGPVNLLSYQPSALPSTIAYYTFELQDNSSVRVSEIFRYNIDTTCYRYTQKRLKWKNRLGGWDYFTFNLRSDKTVEIERNNFNKFRNTLQTGNKYGYSIGDRGQTTYNVKAFDKEVLQSNWLTNDEASWLEELFTSPEVYLIDGTFNSLSADLPVTVTNDNFVVGEKENRGLIAYTINIEYAYYKIIQRN